MGHRNGPGYRISVSILLASIITLALLTAVPRSAHGCSCSEMYSPLSEYVDQVDVAFSGHQVDRGDDWELTVLTFEVDRVYKGEVGPRVELYTSLNSSCGIDFGPAGYTGVAAFAAGPESTELWVHWCGSHVSIEELEEVFGAGYSPDDAGDSSANLLPLSGVLGIGGYSPDDEGNSSALPESSTTGIGLDEVEVNAEDGQTPSSTQPTPESTRTVNRRNDPTSQVDHSTQSVTNTGDTDERPDTGSGSATTRGLVGVGVLAVLVAGVVVLRRLGEGTKER